MRTLDRMVSIQFIKVTFFSILVFCLIFILIDMVENLDDFIDENVPAHTIALYYAYFLPRILGLMVPLAMLLSSLFVVGKMSNNNELTIIKCSGVSLYRFMVPFLAFGVFMSIGMLVFDGWMVPKINAGRINLEREYLKKNVVVSGRYNMYFQDRDNKIVSLEYFDEGTGIARRVSIQQFQDNDRKVLARRFDATSMQWDETSKEWKLFNGLERDFRNSATTRDLSKESETVTRFDSLEIGEMVITPAIIIRMQQKPEEMEFGDFRDYIERQRIAGSDIARLTVDYYGKIAFPFASIIVVFFGVPFASVKRRSGLSLQFGISILICFTYLVSQKLSQVFGYNGNLQPVVAAWLPNILFLLSGCFVMLRVQK